MKTTRRQALAGAVGASAAAAVPVKAAYDRPDSPWKLTGPGLDWIATRSEDGEWGPPVLVRRVETYEGTYLETTDGRVFKLERDKEGNERITSEVRRNPKA